MARVAAAADAAVRADELSIFLMTVTGASALRRAVARGRA